MAGIAGIPSISVVVVVSHKPSLASSGFRSAAATETAARVQTRIKVLILNILQKMSVVQRIS